MIRKKISFITSENDNAGSTRLRVYKIQEELLKRGYEVFINEKMKEADILIFQKSNYYFLEKYFLKYLFSKKFIIFDIDDLYLGQYINFIQNSDLILASTNYLANFYKNYNDNISVLDDVVDVIDINIPLKENINLSNPQIGWFGTTTNLPILEKLNIKNVKTITRGGDIEWSRETVDYDIQKFDLMVIPQEKTPVGLSKTACRMLKALYLGVPVLVNNLPIYLELAKLVNYPQEMFVKDNEDWNEKIEKIKSGEIKFDFDFNECRKIILENYGIEAIVDKWLEIIEQSINNKKKINNFTKILFFIKKGILAKLFCVEKSESKRTVRFFGLKISCRKY